MKDLLKSTHIVVFIVFLSVFLSGCSEQRSMYNEAKKMMELYERAFEVDKFSTAASKLTAEERAHVIRNCTYQEWAGDIFTKLGDYKNSKDLAKEAYYRDATYHYEAYVHYEESNQNPREMYLDRAYASFVRAGTYKDARALLVECGFLKMQNVIEEVKVTGRFAEAPAFFQSFDGESREKIAELLYRQIAPNLAADDWGLDGELFGHDESVIKKRTAYFNDLYILTLIKEAKLAPEDIREKMYCAAVQMADSHDFWGKLVGEIYTYKANTESLLAGRRSGLLQDDIFDYLGDYKDSVHWLKRMREIDRYPVINISELTEQTGRAGSAPQARTVAITYSTDETINNDPLLNPSIQSYIKSVLCEKLKEATKGDIFFTEDPYQACVIIHYVITHEHFGTFNYSGGGVADYYHTNAVTEIRSANGNLLLSKSGVMRIKEPQKTIGGDFKHINITQGVPIYDAVETLKILETQFAVMENQ